MEENKNKFLGICIVVASIVISVALVWSANTISSNNRYVFNNGMNIVLDTHTGVEYSLGMKFDSVNNVYEKRESHQ